MRRYAFGLRIYNILQICDIDDNTILPFMEEKAVIVQKPNIKA
jgi:hypothetical protein